jgi:hypothetical protein
MRGTTRGIAPIATSVILALLLLPGMGHGKDLFDMVPSLKNGTGIEKLTAQERATLSNQFMRLYMARPSRSDSSSSGGESCSEKVDSACDDGYRRCRSDCPSSVYHWASGNYLYDTDANSKCEDACRSGKRACEP